jgi:hypothetical protein
VVEMARLRPVLVVVEHLLLAVMRHTTQAQRGATDQLGAMGLHMPVAAVAIQIVQTPQAAQGVAALLAAVAAPPAVPILAVAAEQEAHLALVATAALAL